MKYNQFCWKEDGKSYPWTRQTSNEDFAKIWKRETFRTVEPAKSPIPKTQMKTHMKTVFGELSLVMTSTKSTKTTPGYETNKNQ